MGVQAAHPGKLVVNIDGASLLLDETSQEAGHVLHRRTCRSRP